MTEYLQFVRGLDNHTFLKLVRTDTVPLLPPFDSLVADVLELTNPTPDQVDKVAKLYLHRDDYDTLVTLESDTELALNSYQKLVNTSIRDEVAKRIEYANGDLDEVLDKVENLIMNRHVSIPQHRAKMWDDLDEREDDVLFEFMMYNIIKGQLSVIVAFSGIGKTTGSLCFANTAASNGQTVLMCAL